MSTGRAKIDVSRAGRGAEARSPGGAALAPAWVEWLAVAALLAAFVWRALLPALATLNTDFPNYYLAARLFRDGYPLDRIYDWIWFQRQKDHAGLLQGLVGCIEMSPFSALVLVPLLFLPALEAKRAWIAFNVLLLLLTGYLLRDLTRQPARRIALVVLLCVIPLRTNFTFGQQHLLVLFLMTLAAWLHLGGRSFRAGLTLAIAAALKVYPALFLLYFARQRAWRAAGGLASGLVALGALALPVFGVETVWTYAVHIVPRVLEGEGNEPYLVSSGSPTILLRRLLVAEPELNPHPLAHAPAIFAGLQPLVQNALLVGGLWLLRARRPGHPAEKLDVAATVALLLLLSPGSSTYHFCVLILAGALAIAHLLERGDVRRARAVAVAYALVCMPLQRFFPAAPEGWRTVLGFPRLYALAALCGLLFAAVSRSHEGPPAPRRERWLAGAIVAALTLLGMASQRRHLDGQFENYRLRLPGAAGSALTTTPAAAADDEIYFTRMEGEGYGLGRTGRPLAARAPHLADLFHPSVVASEAEGWIELAATTPNARTPSRLLRFPRAAAGWRADELPVEVEDGEQPAISADGRWLAFLRERHGRNGLWVRDRRPAVPAERLLVPAVNDVLELAFFPDGRIVFSARPAGRAALFVVAPGSGRCERVTGPAAAARHPAVSPDGRWLVYSEEEGTSWQLWLAEAGGGGGRRRLTRADCNSTSATFLPDSRTVVYATDCGRGVGQTALCRLTVVP